MTDSPRPDSFEVADYLGVLRRRGWIAFVLACLGALAAAGYLAVAPKTYTSSASVYVTPNAANQNVVQGSKSTQTAVNMDNEAQIVQSNTVAVVAKQALHSSLSPQQLAKQVSVAVPANTSVLNVGCSAPSPDSAAACAEAFAHGYLTARRDTATGKLNSELTQEQDKATKLQARTVTLHNRVRALPPNSPALAQAKLQLKIISAKLGTLRVNISNIHASVNTSPGYIINNAVPPAAAASPKPLLYLPSGLLAGLLIGLVIAFLLDRRDDRIHSPRDVERFLDLPVLFHLDARKLGAQSAIAAARSRTGRAYTELAQAVASGLGDGHHVLLVAGTSAGPAASIVAANLAATLARTRAEVMLVCADLRDAVTAALLGVGDARGLAEILAGTATVTEVARQSPEVSRLRVITPGVDTTAALTHMQHDASRRLVAELQRDAQYVVIDAQATGDGADTFSLAEFADAALVVLERERTRQAEARDSIRRLDRMHTAVLGAAVLPNIRRRGRGGPAPARREPRPAPAAVPAVPAAPPAPAPPSAARPPAGAVPAYPAQAVPRVTGGPRPPAGRDDADDADPGPVTPESAVPEPAAPEPADLAPADPAPAAGPGEGWAGSGPGWPASGEGHGDDQDHGDPQGSPAAPGRPASANGTTPAGRKPPRGAGETWPLPRVPVSNPATSRQRHPRTGDPADQAGEGG